MEPRLCRLRPWALNLVSCNQTTPVFAPPRPVEDRLRKTKIQFVTDNGKKEETDEDSTICIHEHLSIMHWDTGQWRGVSAEAQDLVRCMLRKDVSSRLDCSQCLEHTWVRNFLEDQLSKENMSATQTALRDWRISRRFRVSGSGFRV